MKTKVIIMMQITPKLYTETPQIFVQVNSSFLLQTHWVLYYLVILLQVYEGCMINSWIFVAFLLFVY